MALQINLGTNFSQQINAFEPSGSKYETINDINVNHQYCACFINYVRHVSCFHTVSSIADAWSLATLVYTWLFYFFFCIFVNTYSFLVLHWNACIHMKLRQPTDCDIGDASTYIHPWMFIYIDICMYMCVHGNYLLSCVIVKCYLRSMVVFMTAAQCHNNELHSADYCWKSLRIMMSKPKHYHRTCIQVTKTKQGYWIDVI